MKNFLCKLSLMVLMGACSTKSTLDIKIGIELYNKQKYDSAIYHLKRAISEDSLNADYHFYLGDSYLKIKDYPKTISHITKSIKLGKENSQLFYKIGYAHYKLKNDSYANLFLRKSIGLDSTNQKAWYYSANIAINNENYIKAQKFLTTSIKLNNTHHQSYQQRSLILYSQGELLDALNDVNKAIQIKDSSYYYYQRAIIQDDLGNLNNSLKSCEKAIKYDSLNLQYRDYKAALLINLNRLDEACKELSVIKMINPNYDLKDYKEYCDL